MSILTSNSDVYTILFSLPPQVYRVLKPGALFVDSAWAMTDLYDPSNPKHVKVKGEIEVEKGSIHCHVEK